MRKRACGWMTGAALGLVAGLPAMAQLKLAVVDVGQVIRQCKKREDLQKGIMEIVKVETNKIDALNDKIRNTQQQLDSDVAKKNLSIREGLEIELAGLPGQVEAQRRWAQIVNNIETAKAMRTLFEDVKKAVEEVAKADGYDLVSQVMSPPSADEQIDVLQEIVRKPVIYFKKETVTDITATVLAKVDLNHQMQKAAPPPPGGAKPPEKQ